MYLSCASRASAVLVVSLLVFHVGCDDSAPSVPPRQSSDVGVAPAADASGRIDGEIDDCSESNSETCDGIDNDCDGSTDEGFMIGEPCEQLVGLCSVPGAWRCDGDSGQARCEAPAPDLSEETCDGLDNDCDGAIDETFNFNSDAANCGECGTVCDLPNATSTCERSECTLSECSPDFVNLNGEVSDGCECAIQDGGNESCNEVDDDCDGAIDEDFVVGNVCRTGVGACAVDGEIVCAPGGGVECNSDPAEPIAEICNGYDDDCDGLIDEAFDNDGDGARACPDIDCAAPCPEGVDCAVVCDNYDCDDNDREVNSQSPEICGDNIDQNCDGQDPVCDLVYPGRITALSVLPAGQAGCRDLDGDGDADNAFGVISAIINPQIANAVTTNQLNLHTVVYGLASSEVNRRFDFAILQESNGAVDPNSLDINGRPINLFPGANLIDGFMTAGPRPFVLALPVGNGVVLELPTANALLTATLTVPAVSAGITGSRLEDGVLTAALREDDLRAAVNAAAPNFAPFLGVFQADLDLDGDGMAESLSVCLGFSVEPSQLADIPPQLGQD